MSRRLAHGVAGGAVLIGALTILARVTGFAKQYVFAHTVGTQCLSSAYFTANQIPNIVFEVVAGGALAGMVVPVLAGATREHASRVGSALLTWVLVALVPPAVLIAVLAGPITSLFFTDVLGTCDVETVSAVSARMLAVFAPQIPLYGVAVVLYGVLQAHHRFAAPALAPLVSSIVVIVAYLVFVPVSGGGNEPSLPLTAGELVLSVGTSLGVLALVLTVLGPAARLGLRWRPTLRFPDGVGVQVRRLASAGMAGLLAQQAAMIVVLVLANRMGGGAIATYNYAWAIYLVPYAVLAVPIATSAFPRLSAAGDRGEFAALSAGGARAVVLVSGLAAGVLAAVAEPGAALFLDENTDVPPVELARTIALFAPGLVGYGLIAHLSRVLYALGRGRAAAAGVVAGWLVAAVAQAGFALALPDAWKIAGLALGMSVGMTVGGMVLLVAVVRVRGGAAVAGLWRAGAAALAGGGAAFLVGAAVVAVIRPVGTWAELSAIALGGVLALAAGVLVAVLVDRPDARALAARFRRGARSDGV
ncbi:murein biosynthesis integral membrane protein MurJ [Nonomuraea longicatena]|uniref:Lipid II flippase MurJ n=1 Tax=Nonomuraea longicatena TaxID=83682 RepID=A0ABN1P1I8_9ACTN